MKKSNTGIKSWPIQERPRERLAKQGPEALGVAELLAILFRTGRAGKSAVEIGTDLLKQAGGLRGIDRMVVRELEALPGMGLAKAAELKAALELGKRLLREEKLPPRMRVSKSQDLAEVLFPHFREMKKEIFMVVLLDAKHRVIGEKEVSVGSLTASLVHPREVMKAIIQESAAAFVAVHNHPSGDVTPSQDDREITDRLIMVAELMGVRFLDHLILGDGPKNYFSFHEKGLLKL